MSEPDDTAPEIWRPIPLANGVYEASSRGRIRCVEKQIFAAGVLYSIVPARVLKPRVQMHGYRQVSIFAEPGKPKTTTVHSLVADAFHGSRPTGHDVNHIDGVRINNRPDNLEYVTRSQNHLHQYRVLRNRPSSATRLTPEQADEIRRRYEPYRVTLAALADEYGVTVSCVRKLFYEGPYLRTAARAAT